MCLNILPRHFKQRLFPFLKKRPAPVTLRNHLIVYKVVREIARGSYVSPYQATPLTLGALLARVALRPELKYDKCTAHFLRNNPLVINAGWHAHLSRVNAERMAVHLPAYVRGEMLRKVIAAVIPAGTDVYYGENLEIAAETMILFSDTEQAARWIVDHPVRRK